MADEQNVEAAPPAEVASSDVLEREPDGSEFPTLQVRDRVFRLRPKIPGMLLSRIARVGRDAAKLSAKSGADLASLSASEQAKIGEAQATAYDVFTRLVHPDDVDEFVEFVETVEPVIEFDELGALMGAAVEAITARPTQQQSS